MKGKKNHNHNNEHNINSVLETKQAPRGKNIAHLNTKHAKRIHKNIKNYVPDEKKYTGDYKKLVLELMSLEKLKEIAKCYSIPDLNKYKANSKDPDLKYTPKKLRQKILIQIISNANLKCDDQFKN